MSKLQDSLLSSVVDQAQVAEHIEELLVTATDNVTDGNEQVNTFPLDNIDKPFTYIHTDKQTTSPVTSRTRQLPDQMVYPITISVLEVFKPSLI